MKTSYISDLEPVVRGCFSNYLFLKNLQYSQENTCVGASFFKVPDLCNFIKQKLQHRYFPVNIAKYLRTASFI